METKIANKFNSNHLYELNNENKSVNLIQRLHGNWKSCETQRAYRLYSTRKINNNIISSKQSDWYLSENQMFHRKGFTNTGQMDLMKMKTILAVKWFNIIWLMQ